MVNLTLKGLVQQLNAMKCEAYRLGIFNRKDNIMINKDFLDFNAIISLVSWLQYKNVNCHDIYIRPANDTDRALLLVDDLTFPAIQAMRLRGMAPACVVETSPDNFQAWVSLGSEPMAKPERKAAARLLAEQFNGDLASADASHYGRLAGFTNRKESRLTSSGYPFVICREADGRDAAKSRALREWAAARCSASGAVESLQRPTHPSGRPLGFRPGRDGPGGDPSVAYTTYYSQWHRRATAKGKSIDPSRGDFAVVCRMLKEGYGEDQIGFALINNSPDIQIRKKNHIDDYVERTIAAAKKMIN